MTAKENQIDLEKLYRSEEYHYLYKRLKELLEIKKEQVFGKQLKKRIQNRNDLLRILALIYYYELLLLEKGGKNKTLESRNEISRICEKIKKLFLRHKNFYQYVLEYPVSEWEKKSEEEMNHSLKWILGECFGLNLEEKRRHV